MNRNLYLISKLLILIILLTHILFFFYNSGQDKSLDLNENVNEDIYDLNVSDLDSDQESLDTHQENLYSDITV